ncbi:hypothetical protein E3N88_30911 [Mikania micrantha]|uniref:PB1 domain-containing protein n=1 Tax=Mikania micrantha TaxID=192012 RepID=A0A5N6MQ74_9ASTR|nr:hypothetical protein E3N88_30911 [Mikania micrantha]
MLCVDVSELITSSKDLDCAYEFQEVHQALQVNYQKHELDEIFKFLKDVCNTHKLPLAQTWTCNSFNSRCIGKVCMSTTGLPFDAKDLRFWHFREACRKRKMDSIPIGEASINGSSPNKNKVSNASNKRMVTVKATFKDDMIKFIFPLSSGLSELKKQVAQRFELETTRFCLNYKDEDDDLILISCDADLHNLMPFSASPVGKNAIKLIVQMVKD